MHKDPARIFLRLFTPELLEPVVAQTNRFASHCSMESSIEPPPTPWMTNVDEMKAFIGFTILMGVVKLPDLYDYWSSSEVLHCFPVASRIPGSASSSFADIYTLSTTTPFLSVGRRGMIALGKCVPHSKMCGTPFLKYPHREYAIDEAMVKYKGQSLLKQYLPMKPIKRGFKVWVRADSSNGFISDLDVYAGKDGSATANLGTKVVERLSRVLVGGCYHLYFDNFSLSLFDSLLADGMYACRTFRKDRQGVPQEIMTVKPGQKSITPG